MQSEPTTGAHARPMSGARVLVVDGDDTTRDAIADILAANGASCARVESAAGARDRLGRERFAAVVCASTVAEELSNAVCDLERARRELRSSREETVQRLSIAAEMRDDATAEHIHRMSGYCRGIAELVGEPPDSCDQIGVAAAMHDVGKIGIPDGILLKQAPLTSAEWDIMRTHCEIGYRILSESDDELLYSAATVALTHHERIDGAGYPRGLRGDQIPLIGRMAAIADVFDALTTERVYRRALPVEAAVAIMYAGRGAHFDGDLLDLFLDSVQWSAPAGNGSRVRVAAGH